MLQNGLNEVPSPAVVAAAAWLVPGAGYWLLGQRARGTTIGLTVVVLFVFGMLIGGGRVVDPPDLLDSIPRQLLKRPAFLGQILAGPLAIYSGWLAETRNWPSSHGRVAEIGTLYTAIAGMLNLLGIIDSAYRASRLKIRTSP